VLGFAQLMSSDSKSVGEFEALEMLGPGLEVPQRDVADRGGVRQPPVPRQGEPNDGLERREAGEVDGRALRVDVEVPQPAERVQPVDAAERHVPEPHLHDPR
jgi:hypothetical protein